MEKKGASRTSEVSLTEADIISLFLMSVLLEK